ncbi:uncharacterized protein LOC143065375 [Mytilus galloprovincialis]|uniref:uncharacterized protein LOC143065375 n=1 Tax=Mytilus galloprovincialis TaxID=29158 RepID=UPI003F7C6CFC
MVSLIEFLKERNIPVDKVEEDKIDCQVILLLSDDELTKYIPIYGDRIAVKDFCKNQGGTGSKSKKKKTLLQKIRKRLHPSSKRNLFKTKKDIDESSSDSDDNPSTSKNIGNDHAAKSERRIELGWLMKEGDRMKQVRGPTGGGTRHLIVDKDTLVNAIKETALKLYFPEGISPRGKIENFVVDIMDFKRQSANLDLSVENIYDRSKMRLLRFYLLTVPKERDNTEQKKNSTTRTKENEDQKSVSQLLRLENHENNSSHSSYNEHTSLNMCSDDEIQFGPVLADIDDIYDSTIPLNDIHTQSDSQPKNSYIANDPGIITNSLGIIADGPGLINNEQLFLDPFHSVKIRVHRGNLMIEMMKIFSDPTIMYATFFDVSMILPTGKAEEGVGEGIFRDCLTEFWNEFMDNCCIGNSQKVPTIRHDFQEEQWLSIGRIIFKGWQIANYLPIGLSIIVMENAMYGKFKSDLMENFLCFITEEDKTLFSTALKDYESVENDELIEALENHSCRSAVTKESITRILLEIAHKEMVQECNFITDAWAKILSQLGQSLSYENLTEIYSKMEPSNRKVTKMLHFSDNLSNLEREVMNHLQRYVRELDKVLLKKFLRFCTGSDLILDGKDTITVEFVVLDGFGRRPIAHTCGRVLRIPRNYENFTIFRSEFNNILNTSVWVMDIV